MSVYCSIDVSVQYDAYVCVVGLFMQMCTWACVYVYASLNTFGRVTSKGNVYDYG